MVHHRGVDAPALTPLAAALLRVPAPERALVIGCGEGEPALLLAREFPAARVRGVDSSAELVRRASARVGLDPEGRIAFKAGSARRLPYPDDFFDLVAQLDGRPAPREAARVLVPEGRLILARSVPPRVAGRLREEHLRWRLAGHGIAIDVAERAGDGKFLVGRLEWRV